LWDFFPGDLLARARPRTPWPRPQDDAPAAAAPEAQGSTSELEAAADGRRALTLWAGAVGALPSGTSGRKALRELGPSQRSVFFV